MALLLGLAGTAAHVDKAQAKPTDVISINPYICYALTAGSDEWDIDWNADTTVSDAENDYSAAHACLPPFVIRGRSQRQG